VISTSRRPDREKLLLGSDADEMLVDSGTIAGKVRELYPEGVHKVLELIGTSHYGGEYCGRPDRRVQCALTYLKL
jgi:hypothetical protein